MEIKQFKAGTWKDKTGYRVFCPKPINQEWVVSDPELNTLIAKANRSLGELNAFSMYVPDVNFFIFMHVVKEATTSSRIEGTQTRLEEALYEEEDIQPEKREDWREVRNYIQAMDNAIEYLERLPVSGRLLKRTHKILLQGVRGKGKRPGQFRATQNWIGGATIRDASFVPPEHIEVPDLMGDLEVFLHNENIHVPELLKIGIAHYQFETIHPFLDGNGRLGRLLTTLYLVSRNVLVKPTLYLSAFFDKNRTLYYDNLNAVRYSDNLSQWIRFFMVGVEQTAREGVDTFKTILSLKERLESEFLMSLGRKAPNGRKLLQMLWKNPVISANKVVKNLEVSAPTANTLIKTFQDAGILEEQTGYKRNRIFIFNEYLDLFLD